MVYSSSGGDIAGSADLKNVPYLIPQKNQLGMIIGYGCGIVFMLQFAMTVAVNLGLLPPTSIVLPLFAGSGGGTIITSYILLGLTLSIYRYKDITTERMPRKQKITEICE